VNEFFLKDAQHLIPISWVKIMGEKFTNQSSSYAQAAMILSKLVFRSKACWQSIAKLKQLNLLVVTSQKVGFELLRIRLLELRKVWHFPSNRCSPARVFVTP
jgi:hypothetical protein